MPLELQEFQNCGSLILVKFPKGVLRQESPQALHRAVQNDIDILVAGGPRVLQETASLALKSRRQGVSKPIQGFPQWSPPFLIPARMTAGIAAAIAAPPFDTVHATPGAILEYLRHLDGRMPFQVLAIIGYLSELFGFDVIEG